MFYKLTLKKNNVRYPTLEHYTAAIGICKGKGLEMIEWHYEIDATNKLHMHALCRARSNYYAKKLLNAYELRGFHVFLEKLKQGENDVSGWLQYIRKDEKTINESLKNYYKLYVDPGRAQYTEDMIHKCTDAYQKRMQLDLDLGPQYEEPIKMRIIDMDLEDI